MENKYYTPEIEEFHVGFECEFIGDRRTNWIKCVIDWMNINFITTFRELAENKYRVKYLDREDIEELGFEYAGENSNNPNALYYFGKHSIIHNKINNRCVITMWDENRPADYAAFVGAIKNKSELKKLMVQLGIK